MRDTAGMNILPFGDEMNVRRAIRKNYAGRYDDLRSTAQILVNAEAVIDLAVARHPGPAIASPFPVFCLYPWSFRSNVLGSLHKTKTEQSGSLSGRRW